MGVKCYSATQIAKQFTKKFNCEVSAFEIISVLKDLNYLNSRNNPTEKAIGEYDFETFRGKRYLKWYEDAIKKIEDRFVERKMGI
jgi:hypothetical protein